MNVLEINNLGKAYRRYASEWRRFLSWFNVPFQPVEEHWVLRDVNFKMKDGESVGIIGRNGAGKSTLLKLITGTQQPTNGNILVNGRISAILELGMGFNPEFTGRQNAYHGLGLMGYEHAEIERVMPDVELFAEIDEYFDRPMRTYSSGMQMRVAFAVATAFRPDILIVDEALSVGDAYFQHKSFDRIREFQKSGTSLLLVSHDHSAIHVICDRALLIEKGNLLKEGKPEEISDYYNALIAEREENTIQQIRLNDGRLQTQSGTGDAMVENIRLLDSKNRQVDSINVGEQVTLQIEVRVNRDLDNLVLGYIIRDRMAQQIYGTNTYHTKQTSEKLVSGEHIRYNICFQANIGPGSYSVSTALVDSETHLSSNYEWRDLALTFSVENRNRAPFIGLLWMEPSIKVAKK